MKQWLEELRLSPVKKALPILSFPAVQLLGVSVKELISHSDRQAEGMRRIAQRTDSAAAVSLMDLSVEAECFGSEIRVTDTEVPTVVGRIVRSQEEAEALQVPKVGSARSGLYVETMEKAVRLIRDRPVFAGAIGPFSLAARLLDVAEIMLDCYDEPELVETVLEKAAAFITAYCGAFKAAGAHGVVLAEPVTGLLSPALAEEFSTPYVKKIVAAVQDDSFLVIYHNCGNHTVQMIDSILETGAAAYHFGNAIDMREMLKRIPPETVVMGNVDPAGEFLGGTPQSIYRATQALLEACGGCPNFVISSGCDIPPLAKWENIDAFYAAVRDYSQKTSKI